MKRLLFQLSSIICCVILIASCESNVIDGVQYIQGPGDCIECHQVTWSGNTLRLTSDGGRNSSQISFKSKINGQLHFEYYNGASWFEGEITDSGGIIIYVNGSQIWENAYTNGKGAFTPVSINAIKRNDIIKICYYWRDWGTPASLITNISISTKPLGENTNNNSNPSWDF